MTQTQLQEAVLAALFAVAPEAEGVSLARDADIREELDLDSMDFLNFITALHERFGVDIPEQDYGKLATVDAAVDYIGKSSAAS